MNEVNRVKIFLEANSKEELIIKQIENNISLSQWTDYSDPQFVNGKWIVWYFGEATIDLFKPLKEASNGNERR